ncbi:MAG: site-specific DNA-methyltransferase [Clostridia bacterium]|nr:site-specific DNA-methyltransferase [Clostridia bacterium]
MSRIEDIKNALEKGRAIFEEVMNLDGALPYAIDELYSPGNQKSKAEISQVKGIVTSADNLEYMEYLIKEKNMAGKIQMIYVDPPFFSNSKYQASVRLESDKLGKSPVIKTGAYDDTWEDSLEQYLTMLTVRFMFMRELLSDTGCIWVHLDWHGSHYVKLILDEIFGHDNFVNEVIWTYKSGGASKKSFARKHDTLLMYSKTKNYKFNPIKEKSYNRDMKPYRFKGVEEFQDEKGWYTMVNMKDVWSIDMVGRTSGERTGYATQKPEKLLERIVESCTDEGDICADFFAGSGTLGVVAEKMGRSWIMCDEGNVAIASQIERLCKIKNEDGSFCRPFAVARIARHPDEAVSRLVRCSEDMGVLRIRDYVPDLIALSDADEEIALEYLKNDSGACIRFWSVDSNYDGRVHRAHELIGGTDFTTLPEGSLHVIGYDVFGNRFCWEKIV